VKIKYLEWKGSGRKIIKFIYIFLKRCPRLLSSLWPFGIGHLDVFGDQEYWRTATGRMVSWSKRGNTTLVKSSV
jgi:hypothetical protein